MSRWQRRLQKMAEEYLLANWRQKLGALAIAFGVWVLIAGQQTIQAVYSVPVFFEGLPEKTVIMGEKKPVIQVTVSGRRDRILALKESQIWVSVSLDNMNPGRNDYRLSRQDIMAPLGIEIRTFSPRRLTVELAPETNMP